MNIQQFKPGLSGELYLMKKSSWFHCNWYIYYLYYIHVKYTFRTILRFCRTNGRQPASQPAKPASQPVSSSVCRYSTDKLCPLPEVRAQYHRHARPPERTHAPTHARPNERTHSCARIRAIHSKLKRDAISLSACAPCRPDLQSTNPFVRRRALAAMRKAAGCRTNDRFM